MLASAPSMTIYLVAREASVVSRLSQDNACVSRFTDVYHLVKGTMVLNGKNGLIISVASKHSIAWAIAQSAAGQGAQLIFNYQNERDGIHKDSKSHLNVP